MDLRRIISGMYLGYSFLSKDKKDDTIIQDPMLAAAEDINKALAQQSGSALEYVETQQYINNPDYSNVVSCVLTINMGFAQKKKIFGKPYKFNDAFDISVVLTIRNNIKSDIYISGIYAEWKCLGRAPKGSTPPFSGYVTYNKSDFKIPVGATKNIEIRSWHKAEDVFGIIDYYTKNKNGESVQVYENWNQGIKEYLSSYEKTINNDTKILFLINTGQGKLIPRICKGVETFIYYNGDVYYKDKTTNFSDFEFLQKTILGSLDEVSADW